MNLDVVHTIRHRIHLAHMHEANTGHMRLWLEQTLDRLHNAIVLPEQRACDTLMSFVHNYVDRAPDFLEAVLHLTHHANIYQQTRNFFRETKRFFVDPPSAIKKKQGLEAVLPQSFLAHRLIEEVNDSFIGHCGVPLAPMDMTRSNLIAHHLLGDECANELEIIVSNTIGQLRPNNSDVYRDKNFLRYIEEHKQSGWEKELHAWPCLAHDLEISFQFANQKEQFAQRRH